MPVLQSVPAGPGARGVLTALCLIAASSSGAAAQSLAGVALGTPIGAVQRIVGAEPGLSDKVGAHDMQKFLLADENELSVTAAAGSEKIVFIELDWSREEGGSGTDVAGFRFGKTTLAALNRKLGSAGFMFEGTAQGITAEDGGVTLMTSYELSDRPGMVVTFATRMSAEDARTLGTAADSTAVARIAVLDGVVLADKAYLQEIWGKPAPGGPGYAPVEWPGDKDD